MDNKILSVLVFAFLAVFIVMLSQFVLATTPNGASLTPVANDTYVSSSSPEGHAAIAGNITEITVTGASSSQSWQGYFGNVSGIISLGDGSGNVFYNWTSTNAVTGEVYASLNSSITWAGITCFNMSTNHSQQLADLEAYFVIGGTDSDGINETFNLDDHAAFSTGVVSFVSGECNNTKVFGPGGTATFDEVILIDTANSTVYVAIIDDDTLGFDSEPHDFEMLVPEDGHSGDTALTQYYFYAEILA